MYIPVSKHQDIHAQTVARDLVLRSETEHKFQRFMIALLDFGVTYTCHSNLPVCTVDHDILCKSRVLREQFLVGQAGAVRGRERTLTKW